LLDQPFLHGYLLQERLMRVIGYIRLDDQRLAKTVNLCFDLSHLLA
jgi:hypothetical protein